MSESKGESKDEAGGDLKAQLQRQLAARMGAGSGGGAGDGDSFKPVVRRLYGFVMSRMQYELADWFGSNLDTFAGDELDRGDGAGFRHEYAELHREFEGRMEELLSEFCSSEGLELGEFMAKCTEVRDRPRGARFGRHGQRRAARGRPLDWRPCARARGSALLEFGRAHS